MCPLELWPYKFLYIKGKNIYNSINIDETGRVYENLHQLAQKLLLYRMIVLLFNLSFYGTNFRWRQQPSLKIFHIERTSIL